MIKINKTGKKACITLLSALFCGGVAAGVITGLDRHITLAESVQLSITTGGASIRLAEDDTSGIRFPVYINAEEYEANKENISETGVLLLPSDKLSSGAQLTLDTALVQKGETTGNWETSTVENHTSDKVSIVYLYGIPEGSYDREITARGYIKLTDGSVIYSDVVERSIMYVATKALEDTSAEWTNEQKTMLSDYTTHTVNGATVKLNTEGQTVVSGIMDEQETNLAVTLEGDGAAKVNGGEIDLTAYYTGSGTAKITANETEYSAAVTNGKVSLTTLPATLWGEQNIKVQLETDTCLINVTAPVLLLTKYISTPEDVATLGTVTEAIGYGGYYKLTKNIEMYGSDYKEKVVTIGKYRRIYDSKWVITENEPFVGTIDGDGYKIGTLTIRGTYGASGDYEKVLQKAYWIENFNGTLKNIQFENYNAYSGGFIGTLATTSDATATIENVYLHVNDWTAVYDYQFFCMVDPVNQKGITINSFVVDFTKAATKNTLKDKASDPYSLGNWYSLFGRFVNTWYNGETKGCTIYAKSVTNFAILGLPSGWYGVITTPGKSKGADADGALAKIYVAGSDTNTTSFPETGWDSSYWTIDTSTQTITFKRNK